MANKYIKDPDFYADLNSDRELETDRLTAEEIRIQTAFAKSEQIEEFFGEGYQIHN